MASSAIRQIHYRPARQELSIWFGPEGRRYKYFNVPEYLYQALRNAPSQGRFFNQNLRGRFECRLIDPSEKITRRWQAIRSS